MPASQPTRICVEEECSPYHPPPPNTTTTLFSVTYAYASSLEIGQVIQLLITTRTAAYDAEDAALSLQGGDLLSIPIQGPIIGVRRQDEWDVEFVVRNDFEGAQIQYAYLRAPRMAERPAREAFADELAKRLVMLKEGDGNEAEEVHPPCHRLAPTFADLPPGYKVPSQPIQSVPRASVPADVHGITPAAEKKTPRGYLKYKPRISSPLATESETVEA